MRVKYQLIRFQLRRFIIIGVGVITGAGWLGRVPDMPVTAYAYNIYIVKTFNILDRHACVASMVLA